QQDGTAHVPAAPGTAPAVPAVRLYQIIEAVQAAVGDLLHTYIPFHLSPQPNFFFRARSTGIMASTITSTCPPRRAREIFVNPGSFPKIRDRIRAAAPSGRAVQAQIRPMRTWAKT